MELMHEPEPTAEAVTEARLTLRLFWKLIIETSLMWTILALGWTLGDDPSWLFGVEVPKEIGWLATAVVVVATVELVTAGVIARQPSRKQKEPSDRPRMNPVVLAIGFVFITGLFLALFFGYLIMRNAMLAV